MCDTPARQLWENLLPRGSRAARSDRVSAAGVSLVSGSRVYCLRELCVWFYVGKVGHESGLSVVCLFTNKSMAGLVGWVFWRVLWFDTLRFAHAGENARYFWGYISVMMAGVNERWSHWRIIEFSPRIVITQCHKCIFMQICITIEGEYIYKKRKKTITSKKIGQEVLAIMLSVVSCNSEEWTLRSYRIHINNVIPKSSLLLWILKGTCILINFNKKLMYGRLQSVC